MPSEDVATMQVHVWDMVDDPGPKPPEPGPEPRIADRIEHVAWSDRCVAMRSWLRGHRRKLLADAMKTLIKSMTDAGVNEAKTKEAIGIAVVTMGSMILWGDLNGGPFGAW